MSSVSVIGIFFYREVQDLIGYEMCSLNCADDTLSFISDKSRKCCREQKLKKKRMCVHKREKIIQDRIS